MTGMRPPTKAVREYTFSDDDVREWCERSDSSNSLYLDDEERIVPLPMILDVVSGRVDMLMDVRDSQAPTFVSSVNTDPYTHPICLEETVEISVEVENEGQRVSQVHFEARSLERDVARAKGSLRVSVR